MITSDISAKINNDAPVFSFCTWVFNCAAFSIYFALIFARRS